MGLIFLKLSFSVTSTILLYYYTNENIVPLVYIKCELWLSLLSAYSDTLSILLNQYELVGKLNFSTDFLIKKILTLFSQYPHYWIQIAHIYEGVGGEIVTLPYFVQNKKSQGV